MLKFTKRILFLLLLLLIFPYQLVSCSESETVTPSITEPVVLRLRRIDGGKVGLYYSAEQAGPDGTVLLPDGSRAEVGSYKLLWSMLSEELGVEFCEISSEAKELDDCDLVIGTVTQLDRLAREGQLLELSEYFSQTPELKSYLYENDLIFNYLGETKYNQFGVYAVPARLEETTFTLLPYMNAELVRRLLDTDFVGSDRPFGKISLTPYMPREGEVTVEVMTESGETETVTKSYSESGNIISLMQLYDGGNLTGDRAARLLRNYIDQAYGGYYGERRSDLFLGYNAAYDGDELAALLICAMANAELLFPEGELYGLTVSDADQAVSALASVFGVRGPGDPGYTYVNYNGKLVDSRSQLETYELLDRANDWIETGILKISDGAEDFSSILSFGAFCPSPERELILPPVARWYNGENVAYGKDAGSYIRFTESVAFADDIAIGISRSGAVTGSARLNAALELINLAFSDDGASLLGCDAWLGAGISRVDDSADAKLSDLKETASALGYRDTVSYLADYFGAATGLYSISERKFSDSARSKELLSLALEGSLIRTLSTDRFTANWYIAPPTLLPYTSAEYESLSSFSRLLSGDEENGFRALARGIVYGGFSAAGFTDAGSMLEYARLTWHLSDYAELLSQVYYRVGIYYYEYLNGVEY